MLIKHLLFLRHHFGVWGAEVNTAKGGGRKRREEGGRWRKGRRRRRDFLWTVMPELSLRGLNSVLPFVKFCC